MNRLCVGALKRFYLRVSYYYYNHGCFFQKEHRSYFFYCKFVFIEQNNDQHHLVLNIFALGYSRGIVKH